MKFVVCDTSERVQGRGGTLFLVTNNEIESDQMILKMIQIFAEICHFVRLIT